MVMGSEKSAVSIGFASPAEAERPIAGVPAVARAVREQAEAGAGQVRIGVDGSLSAAALAEIERLRGRAAVEIAPPAGGPAARYSRSAWDIVRRTGKPGDGIVSRWLNRPISQRITWLLLHIPGTRPIHVTIFNALLALTIVPVMVGGGRGGLIAGAILFQAASVLDGVDGEMARATFRTSSLGATLDSAVDAATNLLFLAGLTVHLALRDGGAMGWLGGWSLFVAVVGWSLIARRTRLAGVPLGFDLFKRSGGIGNVFDLAYRIVQTLSSRDCYAFLFVVLIITGLERTALMIFASIATVWFIYVIAAFMPSPKAYRGAA